MADRVRVWCFWQVLDKLDYWLTQARLWLGMLYMAPSPRRLITSAAIELPGHRPTDADRLPLPLIGCKPGSV